MQRRVPRLGAAPSPEGAAHAAAARERAEAQAQQVAQALTEVHVEDVVEDEVDGEVDRLQHVRHLDGHHERRVLLLAARAHAVLDEAQDLGGRHEQDVHDDDRDEDRRDAVVGVDVRGRHAVAAPQAGRLAQGLHEAHIAEGEHGERQADAEREVQPVVDRVRPLPHHHVVVPEVHVVAVAARDRLDLELEEARDVEDDAHRRDERDRRLHAHHADHVARLERVADGQVASHRHDDR